MPRLYRGGHAHCSHQDKAGNAKFSPTSQTYAHKLKGKCDCGVGALARDPPATQNHRRECVDYPDQGKVIHGQFIPQS